MIRIVDYGLGNVQAFVNVYKSLGIQALRATNASELTGAHKIILPGVGSFDNAIYLLNQSGMRETLERLVINENVPLLGVCVGMQILASKSDEGKLDGLGWIPGKVQSFCSHQKEIKNRAIPHMGWNDVKPNLDHPLFLGLETQAKFYFLHSYFFEPINISHVSAISCYDGEFACAVTSGHVHGVQFHPEKSHKYGTRLLKNFWEL